MSDSEDLGPEIENEVTPSEEEPKKVKKPMSEAKKKQLDAAREVKQSRYKLQKEKEALRIKNLEDKLELLSKEARPPVVVPLQKEAVKIEQAAPRAEPGWNVYSILIPVVGIASVILTKYLELKAKEARPPPILAASQVVAPVATVLVPKKLDFFS